MQYNLLQLVISSPLIHALGDPSKAPTGIQTEVPSLKGSLAWEADNLPTELSVPPIYTPVLCCPDFTMGAKGSKIKAIPIVLATDCYGTGHLYHML